MTTVIIISFIGAILAAVVGTFWYSPGTPMGKLHMRYLGFDKLSEEEKKKSIENAKPGMPKIYTAQMALSFLTAFFTVFVVTMSVNNGVPLLIAMIFPVFAWLCFTVPTVGSSILWGNCDRNIAWKKFFSDIFSNLIIILLIAVLTGLFV